ncbi:MAG: DUF1343 domain-containing protein [Ignavibacteriae bacterium]|nr:DUF1343 domain-containing protein [Ignavibacteriota bacterium]
MNETQTSLPSFTVIVKNAFVLSLLYLALCTSIFSQQARQIKTGADEFYFKHSMIVSQKRVGIVCNKTSLLSNGVHIVDYFVEKGIHVTALFSPEHGFRGEAPAGTSVESTVDPLLGIPIYSLYGKNKKPTKEMLEEVDVLIFDMQDVGARFYTYVSTMAYAMQAAAEQKKEFIVFDRPNPINGVDVEGPVLDTSFSSFVGIFPIPIRHGLTIGEIARMIRYEWWKIDSLKLSIIPMRGWERGLWYNQGMLHWTPPSPNIKTLATAIVYPGTCLFEATNVSEGRGTSNPFEFIGAPWIDKELFSSSLNALHLPGILFEPITFTPADNSAPAANPKYKDVECQGVFMKVTDRTSFKPVETAVAMLTILQQMYPDKLTIDEKQFDRLAGVSEIRKMILQGKMTDWSIYQNGIEEFKKIREQYLIY